MRRSKRVVEQTQKKRDSAITLESTKPVESDSHRETGDKRLQEEEGQVCSGCKLSSPRIKRFVNFVCLI